MNSRDRVFAAVKGASFDRRPFSLMLSLYGARLTECPLDRYYTDPAAYACGQKAIAEIFRPDILFSPFALVAEGEAFGSRAKYFDRQAPNLCEPAVEKPGELTKQHVPDIDAHPRLLYIREALRKIVSENGGSIPVAGTLLNPVDLPILIMGINSWLEAVIYDIDGAKRVLEITVPYFISWANALLEDGADFLVIPASFLNPAIVTRDIAEHFAVPVLREAFAEVRGPIILHHAGAPFLAFLELFSSLPNVAGFVVDHQDCFLTARRKSGPDRVLLGGLDVLMIEKESPEKIEEHCRAILRDRQSDRCYILTNSGPDITFATPAENIHAVRKALESIDV